MKNHCTLKFIRRGVTLAGLVMILVFLASGDLLTNHSAAHSRTSCSIEDQWAANWSCVTNYMTSVSHYGNDQGENHCQGVDYVVAECPLNHPNRPACLASSVVSHGAMYDCLNITETAYDDRYVTYGSCIFGHNGFYYDVDTCTPPYDPCPSALYEADLCIGQFPYSQDSETDAAREACLNAVPHGRAKGRDPGCAGFPIAP